MSALTGAQSARSAAPRLFWRRAVAYLIDMFVFQTAVMLVYSMSVGMLAGGSIFGNVGQAVCRSSHDVANNALITRSMGLSPTDHVFITQCSTTMSTKEPQALFLVVVLSMEKAPPFPRISSFKIDSTGLHQEEVSWKLPLMLPGLIDFAVPLLFALFSLHGRQTLGKKIFGLQVAGTNGQFIGGGRAILREYLKFWPLRLTGIIAFVLVWRISIGDLLRGAQVLVNTGSFAAFPSFLIIVPLAEALLFIWWFGPFVVWRGQTWYDRISATKVIRTV